jgi:nucleotide-binding universal stress UspA family protein
MLAHWTIFGEVPIRVVSVADVVVPWTSGIAPTMYTQVLDAYAADLRQAKMDHERLTAEAAARLREAGRVVDAEMRAGDAAGEIIALAEQQGADLIVLGSRGRTGLTRVLLGSVARNVLSGSTASVLIVRDGLEEPAEVEAVPS